MDGRGREWGSRTEEGGQREEEGWAKMKVLVKERRENVKQHEAKGEEAKGGAERRVKMTPLTGCT